MMLVLLAVLLAAAGVLLLGPKKTEGFTSASDISGIVIRTVADITGQNARTKVMVAAGDVEKISLTKVSREELRNGVRMYASPKLRLRSGVDIVASSFAVSGATDQDADRKLAEVLAALESYLMSVGLLGA